MPIARAILLPLTLCALLLARPALAVEKVALVIGNAAYAHEARLRNPENDAAAMETALETLGFAVTRASNLDEDGLEDAIADFERAAERADIALVFYSGHGMEIGGRNWLIPTDARLERASDAPREAVDLATVQAAAGRARRLSVVIVDACRDNRFGAITKGGGTKGLKRPDRLRAQIVGFAAAPGRPAYDGRGRLSPYTQALTERLRRSPAEDVRILLSSLADRTRELADGPQEPSVVIGPFPPQGNLNLAIGVPEAVEPTKTGDPPLAGGYRFGGVAGSANGGDRGGDAEAIVYRNDLSLPRRGRWFCSGAVQRFGLIVGLNAVGE